MNRGSSLAAASLLSGAVLIAACGSEAPPAKTTEPAAPPAAASTTTKRAYFVEPADGATVKSPVKLKFGVEGLEIAAVPQGEVTTARANMGHYHVAVDTDCLPPGTVIPKGQAWVHFGDGKSEMDMQLTPGSHKLALAVGDDLHASVAGFCTTITVNATP
jgi:hypothetical protein